MTKEAVAPKTWADYSHTHAAIRRVFRISADEPLGFVDDPYLDEVEQQNVDCAACVGLPDCTMAEHEGWIHIPLPYHSREREMFNGFVMPETTVMKWHAMPCRYQQRSAAMSEDETSAEAAHVSERYRSVTLGNFEQVDGTEKAVGLCERYIAKRAWLEGRGLVIIGTVGTGKTHLAAAIINAARRMDARCEFTSAPDVLGQGKRIDGDKWGEVAYNAACEADITALDDIGTEYIASQGNWAQERLHTLLDTRYRDNRGTVITSNLPLSSNNPDEDTIRKRFGERVYSRIQETCVLAELECDDYRLGKT